LWVKSQRQSYAAIRSIVGCRPTSLFGGKELRSVQSTAVNQAKPHPGRFTRRRDAKNSIKVAHAVEVAVVSSDDVDGKRRQSSERHSAHGDADENLLFAEVAERAGATPGF